MTKIIPPPEVFELASQVDPLPEYIRRRKVAAAARLAAGYDAFKIEGPAVISFSGGRTSGYMLWRILQSHGGPLPADVYVMFENTGDEDEATLRFVRDCELHWGVKIYWVEYRARKSMDDQKQHAIVSFETASRNGEPFDALIQERKMLPNPRARFCRTELKYRAAHRVIIEHLGLTEWTAVIGLRADEPDRVAKLSNQDDPREEKVAPLAEAGIVNLDVLEFWSKQPFDLGLPVVSGKTLQGNCKHCFLKAADTQLTIARHDPQAIVRMVRREQWAAEWKAQGIITGDGDKFRLDRPSYASLQKFAQNQGEMISFGDEDIIDCGCGS